jgi:DNA polymerase I
MQASTEAVTLSRGGLPGETEVLTTEGPIAVAGLEVGDRVYALNPSTRVLKRKRLAGIDRYEYEGPLVHADARRIDWLLHPDQRVPYRTDAIERIRMQRAGDLDEIGMYRLVNEWRCPSRPRLESVDVTEFVDDFQACVEVDCHGHTFRAELPDGCVPTDRNGFTGYHFDAETFKLYQETLESLGTDVRIREKKGHRRRPYRFDGDDFIRFIGWFVTEGSLTDMLDSDSTCIAISQKTPEYRDRIQDLFERLEIDVHASQGSFAFSSNLYARLLRELCGEGCRQKRLPEFVWNLDTDQQELLLRVLMDGDGNDWKAYYTTSRQLLDDVLKLCVETGRKPRYTYKERTGCWEIYVGNVNDQLSSKQQVSTIEDSETLYRLAIEDYSLIMAGRNGRFQWLGVSDVS